ncbi:MAG: class I SAM-dependent methyltransferase [Pyrinomonadaceae bacterium]
MKLYQESVWKYSGPANGESGRGLANVLITEITKLENLRSICDLGCGNGYLTGRLASLGYDVVGVDASQSGLDIASQTHPRSRFILEYIDAQLVSKTGLQKVDLVVASDIIEHLYRPADLLEAASSLLDNGGHLILTTPYHGYLKNVVLSILNKMDSHFTALVDGGHIKFFSVKTLSDIVKRYGFEDLRFSFYGRAPWLWKNMICHARRVAA